MSERDQSQLLLMTKAGALVLVLAATAALSGTAIAQTRSQKPSQQEPSPPADGALQPQDLTLPLVSFTDLSQQEVQWVLSAGVEKAFIRFPGIATIGGVADVFVPLNKVSPSIVVPETQTPLSITPRGGIKIGF